MKRNAGIVLLVIAVFATAAVLLLKRERVAVPSPITPVATTEKKTPEPESAAQQSAAPNIPAAPVVLPPPDVVKAKLAEKPVKAVPMETALAMEVLPRVTLATVNNIAITLKDLTPIRSQDKDQPVKMEAEDYHARLESAIEAELTFQTAQAQGVTLTEEQLSTVQSLRARAEGDIAANRKQGLMWTSITEEQMAFTERYVKALLLQKNLLEKQGIPTSPVLTEEQIQQYYEANKKEYGELPSDPAAKEIAWKKIHGDIVDMLWPYLLKSYEEEHQQYIQELKDHANISRNAENSTHETNAAK